MVWGPLGVAFAYGLYLFWDYYRSEIKPTKKQDRLNRQEAHNAHLAFLNVTSTSMVQQTSMVADIRDTQKQHGETLNEHGEALVWIKGRLDFPPRHGGDNNCKPPHP